MSKAAATKTLMESSESSSLSHSAKAILSSVIATAFEWYDYALFAYFATIIGAQFFPSTDPLASLMSTFAVFATGFAMRPLGAIIFGHIGDKFGRKHALVLSILLMALPTACMGFLPNYQSIGMWAPIFLVSVRLLQGLAVGGNYGGALIFSIEHAGEKNRGLVGSWALFSCIVGLLLGSATATLFSWGLSVDDLNTWGWRVPFIFGILICFLGAYVRHKVIESPKFTSDKTHAKSTKLPLQEVLSKHWKKLIVATGFIIVHDIGFYVLFMFMTTYMTTILKISPQTAMTLNTAGILLMVVLIPVFANMSDRMGRKRIMLPAALGFIVLPLPAFLLLDQGGLAVPLVAQTIFAILMAAYAGPMSTMVVELFPTFGRFTATALALNISASLFGGTAPMLVTYLISRSGTQLIPAYYLIAAGIISFVALLFVKDRYNKPLLD